MRDAPARSPTRGRKKVIAAFERRLAQEITHPLFGYRLSYRRLLEVQTRLLGRHLMGEIAELPAIEPRLRAATAPMTGARFGGVVPGRTSISSPTTSATRAIGAVFSV